MTATIFCWDRRREYFAAHWPEPAPIEPYHPFDIFDLWRHRERINVANHGHWFSKREKNWCHRRPDNSKPKRKDHR